MKPSDRAVESTQQQEVSVSQTQTPTRSDTDTGTRQPPGRRPRPGRKLSELVANYGLVIVFVLVLVVFAALKPATFLSSGNIGNLLTSQSVTALLAFAVMMPLATGRFDHALILRKFTRQKIDDIRLRGHAGPRNDVAHSGSFNLCRSALKRGSPRTLLNQGSTFTSIRYSCC